MDRIERNFRVFHHRNPHVYRMFIRFAFDMINRGYKHGSASLIFERMRWELMLQTDPDDPVRLNNNYRSRYARLFEEDFSRHAGFFRKRRLSKSSVDSVAAAEEPYL